ncbi:hypothetical protein [Desulforamulus aeronauticus]|uniref:Uncharacterized protein n=1 Tax=Desulforamulus aeronauticus DSM 10349 TaxID=1121421 RepID=A0A1M6WEF7_9FIRM|nr:hypothetical protein [Desulforamulus aeronauticus]SHK92160.1 hypothetical protein SAMN02745123_03591 [Desulforamulus aeronauticus DSM 10349]
MPNEILNILESGKMTKEQYKLVLDYYLNPKTVINDWFGSYGVDGEGHYYRYVINYRGSGEKKVFKIYLID